MSIRAYSKPVLAWFTDLLHDSFLVMPPEGLSVSDGTVRLIFEDREHNWYKGLLARFELCIHNVESLEVTGRLDHLPGPTAQLNDAEYDEKDELLTFHFVHPLKITCRVKNLYVALDQLEGTARI